MSQYQLHFAVTLTLSAIGSAATFYLVNRNQNGKIKLTDDTAAGPDPFDITQPDDFVDGFPIEETEFWAQVRCTSLQTLRTA